MQRMGSPRDSLSSGLSETEWVPMAAGLWRFEIGKPTIELSGFKNDDGSDKFRVILPLKLTDPEYERAKETAGVRQGQQVSGRVTYRVGLGAKYPLGFYRDGKYVSTKLADFWCVAFGSKQVNRARKFLEDGGGPDYANAETYEDQIEALQEWLGWIEGCQVFGSVTHSEDKRTPGKWWANFGGPLAVGAIPGQPEPDYQTFGAGKLRAITSAGGMHDATDQPPADVLPGTPEPEQATSPVYSRSGQRIDDHDHPETGMCQVCYDRMFPELAEPKEAVTA